MNYNITLQVFDTWADGGSAMTTFLQGVADNSVVALAVWDTGNKCTGDCFDELKALGSRLGGPLKYAGLSSIHTCLKQNTHHGIKPIAGHETLPQ